MESPADAPQILLASASPRRRELLDQIGIRWRQVTVQVDETPAEGESPETYVRRLALAKARAGGSAGGRGAPPALGADTAVVVEGRILGKPRDREEALAMLALLSGRTHRVMSAVALVQGSHEACRLNVSEVTFRPLTGEERQAYWESGEPADKAGAYAVQGLGALFIRELRGSYSGVMGLPLYETAELLTQFGIRVL